MQAILLFDVWRDSTLLVEYIFLCERRSYEKKNQGWDAFIEWNLSETLVKNEILTLQLQFSVEKNITNFLKKSKTSSYFEFFKCYRPVYGQFLTKSWEIEWISCENFKKWLENVNISENLIFFLTSNLRLR